MDASQELDQVIDGQFKPLDDNERIIIKGGGSSSATPAVVVPPDGLGTGHRNCKRCEGARMMSEDAVIYLPSSNSARRRHYRP